MLEINLNDIDERKYNVVVTEQELPEKVLIIDNDYKTLLKKEILNNRVLYSNENMESITDSNIERKYKLSRVIDSILWDYDTYKRQKENLRLKNPQGFKITENLFVNFERQSGNRCTNIDNYTYVFKNKDGDEVFVSEGCYWGNAQETIDNILQSGIVKHLL